MYVHPPSSSSCILTIGMLSSRWSIATSLGVAVLPSPPLLMRSAAFGSALKSPASSSAPLAASCVVIRCTRAKLLAISASSSGTPLPFAPPPLGGMYTPMQSKSASPRAFPPPSIPNFLCNALPFTTTPLCVSLVLPSFSVTVPVRMLYRLFGSQHSMTPAISLRLRVPGTPCVSSHSYPCGGLAMMLFTIVISL